MNPKPSTPPPFRTARPARAAAEVAQPYHHGDLRQAMLRAAGELLDEEGLAGFTLRACARRAGVSHGAPAHHFGDVRGLLTALAVESFEALHAEMVRHEAAAAPDPFSQLMANGQAYVAYALSHRGRFQLMFQADRLDCAHPRLEEAGRATYGRLEAHVAAVAGVAGAGPDLRDEKALLAWVTVHGLSTLVLENRLFEGDPATRAATARAVLSVLMRLLRPSLEGGGDA